MLSEQVNVAPPPQPPVATHFEPDSPTQHSCVAALQVSMPHLIEPVLVEPSVGVVDESVVPVVESVTVVSVSACVFVASLAFCSASLSTLPPHAATAETAQIMEARMKARMAITIR